MSEYGWISPEVLAPSETALDREIRLQAEAKADVEAMIRYMEDTKPEMARQLFYPRDERARRDALTQSSEVR
jgi:hypothetical protein